MDVQLRTLKTGLELSPLALPSSFCLKTFFYSFAFPVPPPVCQIHAVILSLLPGILPLHPGPSVSTCLPLSAQSFFTILCLFSSLILQTLQTFFVPPFENSSFFSALTTHRKKAHYVLLNALCFFYSVHIEETYCTTLSLPTSFSEVHMWPVFPV